MLLPTNLTTPSHLSTRALNYSQVLLQALHAHGAASPPRGDRVRQGHVAVLQEAERRRPPDGDDPGPGHKIRPSRGASRSDGQPVSVAQPPPRGVGSLARVHHPVNCDSGSHFPNLAGARECRHHVHTSLGRAAVGARRWHAGRRPPQTPRRGGAAVPRAGCCCCCCCCCFWCCGVVASAAPDCRRSTHRTRR